jgi:uncharacterized protein (DUF1778 family)
VATKLFGFLRGPDHMGRKALSGTPKTDRPLRIRLTDRERAILDRAAKRAGLPTSAWAREILIATAKG